MAKAVRKPFVNRDYTKDEYFKRWMVGLSEKTKRSYNFAFKEWLYFIGMTPTEQIFNHKNLKTFLWGMNAKEHGKTTLTMKSPSEKLC